MSINSVDGDDIGMPDARKEPGLPNSRRVQVDLSRSARAEQLQGYLALQLGIPRSINFAERTLAHLLQDL